VKQVFFDGKHKLADTWEKVPYVVVDQANSEIPEVDGFTATGIDFCCLVRVLRTGFGFSCGISCSLINPTGKGKFL
jgi:hypothetical protein